MLRYSQKSIRGSDADAAVYWLVRMIEAGDDPLFIARRLIVAASEDCSDYPLGLQMVSPTLPISFRNLADIDMICRRSTAIKRATSLGCLNAQNHSHRRSWHWLRRQRVRARIVRSRRVRYWSGKATT